MTKRNYSTADIIISLISFAMGYFFIKIIFEGGSIGLGMFMFTVLLIGVSIFYLRAKDIKISPKSMIFISITVIYSFVFVVSANDFLKFLVLVYVIFSSVFWFYSTCNGTEINRMFVFNAIKSFFIMPLSCCFFIYEAIIRIFKKNNSKKTILYITLGIFGTIIPSVMIMILLTSADDMFSQFVLKILRLDILQNMNANIFYFIFGIPVAMYMFGTWFSNSEKMNGNVLSRKVNSYVIRKLRFTPELVVFTAVTPICLIYVLFFVSQSAYFTSAFANMIPEGFTPAEYARRGFFELCNVSIINAVIIGVITTITKRNKIKLMKAYTITLSVFTLMLISTALAKMILYIGVYGLTLSRVYTSWFMVLLACIFILLIVKQFLRKINFFLIAFIIFAILFAILIFCDIDSIIAWYNIENYLNGNLSEVDTDMLIYELSPSAIKHIKKVLPDHNYNTSYMNFYNFNFAEYNANR